VTSTHNPHDEAILRDLAAVERDETLLARDTARLQHDLKSAAGVDVTVNTKHVHLTAEHDTGLKIKQAEIDQGVPHIALDFQLFEEVVDGDDIPVADDKPIRVRAGARFSAIAPDDNS